MEELTPFRRHFPSRPTVVLEPLPWELPLAVGRRRGYCRQVPAPLPIRRRFTFPTRSPLPIGTRIPDRCPRLRRRRLVTTQIERFAMHAERIELAVLPVVLPSRDADISARG